MPLGNFSGSGTILVWIVVDFKPLQISQVPPFWTIGMISEKKNPLSGGVSLGQLPEVIDGEGVIAKGVEAEGEQSVNL